MQTIYYNSLINDLNKINTKRAEDIKEFLEDGDFKSYLYLMANYELVIDKEKPKWVDEKVFNYLVKYGDYARQDVNLFISMLQNQSNIKLDDEYVSYLIDVLENEFWHFNSKAMLEMLYYILRENNIRCDINRILESLSGDDNIFNYFDKNNLEKIYYEYENGIISEDILKTLLRDNNFSNLVNYIIYTPNDYIFKKYDDLEYIVEASIDNYIKVNGIFNLINILLNANYYYELPRYIKLKIAEHITNDVELENFLFYCKENISYSDEFNSELLEVLEKNDKKEQTQIIFSDKKSLKEITTEYINSVKSIKI